VEVLHLEEVEDTAGTGSMLGALPEKIKSRKNGFSPWLMSVEGCAAHLSCHVRNLNSG